MATTYEINRATSTVELDKLIERAAAECNCELDSSMTYKEQADFLRQEVQKSGNGQQHIEELVDILEMAETKWFELEA